MTRTKHVLLWMALAAIGAGVALVHLPSKEHDAARAVPRAPQSLEVPPPAASPPSVVSATGRRPLPTPATSPPVRSFEALVVEYSNFTDEQIAAAVGETNREIEQRALVQRANEARLDERERNDLRLLLRRQNALQAIQVQRLLGAADTEGI